MKGSAGLDRHTLVDSWQVMFQNKLLDSTSMIICMENFKRSTFWERKKKTPPQSTEPELLQESLEQKFSMAIKKTVYKEKQRQPL